MIFTTLAVDGKKHERSDRVLLDVKGLKTYFHTEDGVVRAVNEAFPGVAVRQADNLWAVTL